MIYRRIVALLLALALLCAALPAFAATASDKLYTEQLGMFTRSVIKMNTAIAIYNTYITFNLDVDSWHDLCLDMVETGAGALTAYGLRYAETARAFYGSESEDGEASIRDYNEHTEGVQAKMIEAIGALETALEEASADKNISDEEREALQSSLMDTMMVVLGGVSD